LVVNNPDGSVEAVFEGPADRVDSLVDWCRRGPSGARVDGLEVVDEPPLGEVGFQVR
jgi:acylphosphatase